MFDTANILNAEDVTEKVREGLRECLDAGFQTPLTFVFIDCNGSVAAYRCEDDEEPCMIAEHRVGDEVRLPLNLVVVDSYGEVARFVLELGRPTLRLVR